MTSKAAKAAAVLIHVAMEPSYEVAARIFDVLANSSGEIDPLLDGYNAARYELFECLTDADYWESIENTAITIDQAKLHFGANA